MSTRGHGKKAWVALSGGVDSAVAAALLTAQGFTVVGAFMRCFAGDETCDPCWIDDRRSALRVAAHLGIPLETLNFESAYKQTVFEYMRDGYARGITPNPDVRCNETIKFGLFYETARRAGADFIATGHYARLRHLADGTAVLLKGVDEGKDQSYFLHRVHRKHFARTLFPVGHLTKPRVRALAKKFSLPNADRRSTRGICFVGKVPLGRFLGQYTTPRPGSIITTRGERLGMLPDITPFTVGQRHGIGIGGGAPYFVVKNDIGRSTLTVAQAGDASLMTNGFRLMDVRWVRGVAPALPLGAYVKVRYRDPGVQCTISATTAGVNVELAAPRRKVASGQYAVFYRGAECLGGGIIV